MLRFCHLGLCLLLSLAGAGPLLAQGKAEPRIVVLGVDGLDHALTSEWIASGELPELAVLAREGGFIPLQSTNPAQSPTAWASLVTGENPGETGIFGFLRRGIRGSSVIPELALTERSRKEIIPPFVPYALGAWVVLLLGLAVWRRERRRLALSLCGAALLIGGFGGFALLDLPKSVPLPRPLMGGTPFWVELDRAGIPVRSLFAPMAFPAPDLDHGCLLCGLGVPDAMATAGSVVRWSTDAPRGGAISQMGGKHLPLLPRGDGHYEPIQLLGPLHPRTGTRLEAEVQLKDEGRDLQLQLNGRSVRLERGGAFSPYLEVELPFSRLVDPIRALVRYRLLDEPQATSLYQEPLQIDPRHQVPFARITSPMAYGQELSDRYGPFETLGWASATNPYQDELIDEETFLLDIAGLDRERETMIMGELARPDWRVFFGVVYTPDRVQHMFFADLDPAHPAHDPAAARKRGPVILASYQRVDALIGRIRREILRPGDHLIVLSDHGFAPFRRAVNLNRWLAEEGYFQARADGDRNLEEDLEGDALRHVDWSKTRAYAIGLGRIWINQKGREPQGIVPPEEAEALAEEIRAKLLRLQDGEQKVVRSVRRPLEIYRGSRLADSADLIVGFERGYRISWNACLGGVDEPVFFDNRSRWSGDHCSVDPDLVRGVLFSNRALAGSLAQPEGLVPTLRALLALPPRTSAAGEAWMKAE